MTWTNWKYAALALAAAAGLVAVGFGQRPPVVADSIAVAAADPAKPAAPAKPDESRPAVAGRRREAVIRVPVGTFVKEVDAAPYGSGRITWTYEDEQVTGVVEGSVMGVEFEVATEAEYALSSTGAIYGVLTGFRLNHLRLPDGEDFAEFRPFVGLWPAVEPVVNDVTADLPFSYRFQVQGDRLVISHFRILLAGPNPLGRLGGLAAMDDGGGEILAAFQAVGTALEGTYVSAEAKERPVPPTRPLFRKPGARSGGRTP